MPLGLHKSDEAMPSISVQGVPVISDESVPLLVDI